MKLIRSRVASVHKTTQLPQAGNLNRVPNKIKHRKPVITLSNTSTEHVVLRVLLQIVYFCQELRGRVIKYGKQIISFKIKCPYKLCSPNRHVDHRSREIGQLLANVATV